MAFSPRAGAVITVSVEGAQASQRQVETIGDSFSQMSNVASTGLKFLAAGFAALKIGEYVKDAGLLAARYETLGIVMETAGVNAGYSNAQMNAFAGGLEKSGISMMKSREAMISMTTANLDNNKAVELGRLAQNLAVVANKSSSETLTDLITNIQQADTEGLKHMGIILNQDEALQKYATSHNTVTKALTQTQKAEAIQAAVMQEGAKYAGIYEKAMGTAGKALGSLDRYFENIKVRLGTPLLEGFAQGVFGVTDGVKQLNKWLEQLESNGAMEKFAKGFGSAVGTAVKGASLILEGWSNVLSWVTAGWTQFKAFYDDHKDAMDALGLAAVAFATVYEGALLLRALPALRAFVAESWVAAGAQGVVGALSAMSTAVVNFVRAFTLSTALIGFGPAIVAALGTAAAAIGAFVAAAPALVIGAFVALAVGAAAIFSKTFRQKVSEWTGGVLFKMEAPKAEVVDDKKGPGDDAAKAAANKAEKDRKELMMREMNDSVVAAERQISVVSATNTTLKALNELRDQQLKQSLDQRIITQADYLQKKQTMDVAEAQGQLSQIEAQKSQLAAYMAAFKAGAPLGQGRDPAADANEMIKLSAEAAAAQTKLNAVKQSYAYQIAGALLEGYTKEFGSVSSLVDAQEELVRSSRLAYDVAGKTSEQQEIFSALRIESIAQELSAEMERRRQNGEATREYLDSAGSMVQALEQMGAARLKAVSKGVATGFINDTKQMADETIALYDAMRDTFIGDEEERIKAAAAASIKLASIRLADANTAIDNTGDSDGQKLAAKRKALQDFNKYAQAVHDNADAKVLQSSRGFETLRDAIESAFDVNRIESFGRAMSSAFGSAGAALGDLIDTFTSYDQQQRDNEAARKAASIQYKDDAGKLAAAQSAITTKQTREQLGYYGNLAGAAKGFFAESSAGYKVLGAVEKAYHAAELAMALQTMVKKIFFKESEVAANTTLNATKLGVEATTTAGSTALAATEASAWGVTAVVKAIASMPFPLNLAAGAATLAAVVAIGAKMTGGLGGSSVSLSQQRQEAQGTGSVLGDSSAKSESIKRAIDLTAANSSTQINYLSGMLASLRAIESGIGNFASQLLRTTDVTDPNVGQLDAGGISTGAKTAALAATGYAIGASVTLIGSVLGPVGMLVGALASKIPVISNLLGKISTSIFGGKQSVQDSGITLDRTSLGAALASGVTAKTFADVKTSGGWFHSDKNDIKTTDLGAEANRQFTQIITAMADSIKQAAALVGVSGDDFTQRLNSFVIDIGKVSLKDLKGDDLQKALESVFSKLGDDMAQFAVGGLQQFQQIGEGYLETLVRVASDYAKIDASLTSIGMKFGSAGLQSIAARESLVDLMGGIDEFQSKTASFADNFLTEAERLAPVGKYVSDELAKMNLSWVDTRDEFKQVVLGLDLTTEAGRSTYASLMGLSEAFAATHAAIKDVTKSAQDIADERSDLQDQLDELTLPKDRLQDKKRDKYDDSNKPLYDQVQAAQAAIDAIAEHATVLDLQGQMYQALGDKAGAAAVLEQQHVTALAAMTPAVAAATKEFWAAQTAASAAKAALEVQNSLLAIQAQIYELTGDKAGAAAVLQQQHIAALAALDPALRDATQQLWNQQAAAAAAKAALEISNSLLAIQAQIYELTGDKAGAAAVLQQQHIAALAALDPALRGATQHLWDLEAAAKATETLKSAATTLLAGVDDAFSALQKVVAREKNAVQASVDAHSAAVAKLQSLSESLHSAFDSMKSPDQKLFERAGAQAQIRAALAIARAGGPLPAADSLKDALSAVTQDASSQFSSYQDYLRDLYQTQSDIGQLGDLTDASLSVEQQALEAAQAQLTALDGVLAGAQDQIDVLKGQSISLLSIDGTLQAVSAAIAAAQANPVVSATASIASAYQNILHRAPDAAGMQFWQNQIAAGVPLSEVIGAIRNSNEAHLRPSPVVTSFVPDNMSAADNRALMDRLASPAGNADALAQEVARLAAALEAQQRENAELRQTLTDGLRSIAEHTSNTATHLDDIVNGKRPIVTELAEA